MRPKISRRRKWLFRLAVAVLAPLLFFIVLEAGLRLGGYGYPTNFLVGPDADGTYTSNYRFGWRFFPRNIARKPEFCSITTKPAGTIRIFILGGSAAQGVPDPSFNFGRILEVLLRERYPDVKFEVVNAAMTAINSHVVLEIARDCAAHQPDLFIVYMGNNEVVGPYGPGTVFQQWSPSRGLIRASVWVKSTRVGQLLGDATGWLRSHKDSPKAWRGMEMFLGNQVPADDPRLAAVYENFRRNLVDICGVARRAGAAVILSTVAVNLSDCPPLASQHRADLGPEALTKWKSIYQAGVELEASGRWQEAAKQYQAAGRIDDRFAELQFRLGRCLAARDRPAKARDCFVAARDLDSLRFRADSRINDIIREVAAAEKSSGVRLTDAERELAQNDPSRGGILGGDLFYEHVHLTFDGNYLLARAVLDQVEAALPQLTASRKPGPLLSRQQCAESLVYTPWDECQGAEVMAEMTSRPPFTNQWDHAARQASARKRLEEIRRSAQTPQALRAAYAAYEAALKTAPDDWHLHYRFGKLALACDHAESAIEHLQIVWKKMPWEASVCEALGEAEYLRRNTQEAIAYLRKTIEIDPSFSLAYSNLGTVLSGCGRTDEAIAEYQKALQIDPKSATIHFNLGTVLEGCGRIDQAVEQYQETLKIDPDHATAHNNLGSILDKKGRHQEAIAHYRKALEINPQHALARNNLANALRSCGRRDEAIAEYQKVLEIAPTLAIVHYNLGITLSDCGRIDEAIDHYREALKINPQLTLARKNLERALKIRAARSEQENPQQ
ncbi:MAG: tetratricopeptide repeat protein [Pirellulales bacterium]|nr:tetratricopeptide repeat protein [Pirellulales bacterium]